MSLPYVGMPQQMPQQQFALPPAPKPPEMIIDVLGIRVPAEMLNSPAFWAFLIVAAVTVLGVAWLKYRSSAK
jgi:hypothetical protein